MQFQRKNENLSQSCKSAMRFALGREPDEATSYDKYQSLATVVRTQLMDRRLKTHRRHQTAGAKQVYYLSLEFLMGRTLQNAVLSLDIEDEARDAIHELGMVLEDVYEKEYDAGLGNGGLGRLAACFLDSLATQDYPAKGYGIRYEYGIFNQEIVDGRQVEKPDYWLFRGNPWETPRQDRMKTVRFYGRPVHFMDEKGRLRADWVGTDDVRALPYENPIPGYHTDTVNLLTLWAVKAGDQFNLEYFNHGDYLRAVEQQQAGETISKVLYPNDAVAQGRELRLKQEYFFTSASLQEILSDFLEHEKDLARLPDKVAIQLNDTHPAIAVPELMRILLDEHLFPWDAAWRITTKTLAYTNHTLLPEALETWEAGLLRYVLPRHLEIIYEINHRFLKEVADRFPGDEDIIRRMSIVEEGPPKRIRMAHLAVVGSHSTNGVAALHTELIKERLLPDFYRLWPDRFNNKTNGVTQRRWIRQANPALSTLITENIGDGWIRDLDQLKQLKDLAEDTAFQEAWRGTKSVNKMVLAEQIQNEQGIRVDPDSLFDVQVKRIHEYKRQLLNILGIIARYFRIKDDPGVDIVPRTVMIGGKAAPGYDMAKRIIHLANDVGAVINRDPITRDRLKLVFLPNYRVSSAERIFPASDLSQQISTAGKEASGTGNMKFAMNGALTIGTLDGSNVEIRDAVGDDNIFIFGLSAEEVKALQTSGYSPWDIYWRSDELRRVLDAVNSGLFSPGDPDRYRPLTAALLDGGDSYMLLADFDAYMSCQDRVDACYQDPHEWTRKAILNVAGMGFFSSDRTIREYAREIWDMKPV